MASGLERTSFNPTWLIKVAIMFVVLVAFGSWGLYDALVAYPQRGAKHAEYAEWAYLTALEAADAEDASLFPGGASVENPADELSRLSDEDVRRGNVDAMADTGSRRRLRATMEEAKRAWLVALSRIGALDAERTSYASRDAVRERLRTLSDEWRVSSPPAPLASYDIPSQWIIMGVSYGFAVYLAALFIGVATKPYRWDPEAKRLTIPGGATITPSDLDDVDKRKWDKFIVFLKVREGHASLGGQEIKVDTYRLAKLEGWILEMEAERFPERAAEAEAEAGDEPDETDESTTAA